MASVVSREWDAETMFKDAAIVIWKMKLKKGLFSSDQVWPVGSGKHLANTTRKRQCD